MLWWQRTTTESSEYGTPVPSGSSAIEPSEAMGQSLDLIIPERLRPRHWEGFHRVMATCESNYGAGDLLSVPGLHKDGRCISLEFTIVPLKDDRGQMQGLAAVMRDVTSRFEEIRGLKKKLAEATVPPSPH
jgi:PAS domain S-box-containing protein